MDLYDLLGAIRYLYAEKAKLDDVIASLQELQHHAGGEIPPLSRRPGRRGRKSMSADEREQVSTRMREYWAAKRVR